MTALAAPKQMAVVVFDVIRDSLMIPVALLLTILVFRVVFRRPWLAYAALFTTASVFFLLVVPSTLVALFVLTTFLLLVVLLTRLGLLAGLTAIIYSSWTELPLTADPGSWFFPASVVTMLLFAAVAVYAFVVSLGDQAVFKDSVLD